MTKPPDALPTKIAQSLLQRIISAEFPPGTLLPSERELQDEYHVSRTVVREAIKLLTSRKLLNSVRGQGTVVATNITEPVMDALLLAFYQSQIRREDIFKVRLVLEPESAAMAAQNATIPQIRRISEIAQSFVRLSPDGDEVAKRDYLTQWGKLDREFHQLLAEASQNAVFGILITVIIGIVWNAISVKVPRPTAEQFAISVRQHEAIALAVAAHDTDAARRMMIEHIETSLQNVITPEDRMQLQVESLI